MYKLNRLFVMFPLASSLLFFLLGSGDCGNNSNAPVNHSKISFGAIPQVVLVGHPIKAVVNNAPANPVYAWSVDGVIDSNQTTDTFIVPSISGCDQDLQVGLTVSDATGPVAQFSQKVSVARGVWCTYSNEPIGRMGAAIFEKDLLSNKITKLAVGASGQVWVGTEQGLNHFNGKTWQKITMENNALVSNNITALLSAGKDAVYIGTDKGAQKYVMGGDKQPSSWITYSMANKQLAHDFVNSLAISGEGKLMVGTDNGVAEIDLSGKKPTVNFFNGRITAMAMGRTAQWYGTGIISGWVSYDFGVGLLLRQLSKQNDYVARVERPWVRNTVRSPVPNYNVKTMLLTGSTLYVGLNKFGYTLSGNLQGGLVRASIDRYILNGLPEATYSLMLKDDYPGMPGNDIRGLALSDSRMLWVATSTGLGKYLPGTYRDDPGYWQSFKSSDAGVEMISDDLTALAYDPSTKTLWIGTNGGGLTRLRLDLLK